MTNKAILAIPLVCCLAATPATLPSQSDAVKMELQQLAGIWHIVKEIDDGKEMSAAEAKKIHVSFTADGTWKVELGGKIVGAGTMTLDPTKKPKTIDYLFTQGDDKGKTFRAIYELDGDSFKHCGAFKDERPGAFDAKAGSERSLTFFQRGKPK